MEVSLSACRVSRAEYVDKHVRSIWTLPDIIRYRIHNAWALGLAATFQRPTSNVQRPSRRRGGTQ